jgi:peptide/nickel transport system substrate-binding protein
MVKLSRYLMVPMLGVLMGTTSFAQEMTDVGTPRSETLIVQTFDGKVATPDAQNPFISYAIWRGFRELGWSSLWEMDTASGQSYPELADGMPEVLNAEHTKFRIKIRPGVFWSDGVEFTTADMAYTLDTAFKYREKLTRVSGYTSIVKSWTVIDPYTMEVETSEPSYSFETSMGVYTWGARFVPVPKHIFEPQGENVVTFKNAPAVTLGPYKIKAFDPNGFWQLWERREDWQRSGWGNLGEPKAKYVLYKDFGAEETRTLAFVQNQYDIDTFMSPDSIQAAKARNPNIQTFSDRFPYHDMNDACSWAVYMNQQKAPYDLEAVRWALALSLDLKQVGITALSGQFKVAALPIADTPVTNPIYYEASAQFLNDLTLADGYKPYDPNFGADLVAALKAQGAPESELPTAENIAASFGGGWWKHDPAQAEKLLASVGMTKGADGFFTMPDGSPWVVTLTTPGDWNKNLQRLGFSIADSWKKAGFNVSVQQVDNGEFGSTQSTNSKLDVMLNWGNTCVYNANWRNSWGVFKSDNVKDATSDEPLNGNWMRVTDQGIFDIVTKSASLPTGSAENIANGNAIAQKLTATMQAINLMSIPTTVPTNSTYWTNYSKQDNFYAAPYTWWSSFKKTLVNITPTGK